MPYSAALLCLAFVSYAATTPTNATSKASSASPATPAATPVETEIPQAVFVVPTAPSQGRDPFFPRSTRLFAETGTGSNVKTNQPSFVVELALKGISGTRERPLAIINNQTFAVGEENDVITGTRPVEELRLGPRAGETVLFHGPSRVRIRCVEINMSAGTVIIQVGNERRELRLKQPK